MSYIDYDGRNKMKAVRCKGKCGAVVVAADWKPTPEYCELVIALREPNGVLSKHETAVCRPCRLRLIADGPRPGELEAIFAEDVEQWIETAIRYGMKPSEAYRLAARQAARQPLRVLDEPSRTGAV